MIISHSRRFVFVKPRKTAGTSVELALSPSLAAGDLATPIEPEEEPLRRVAPGVLVGAIRYRHGLLRHRLRDHSTLAKAVDCFGTGLLDYRIISMTRNPWDRAVSQFFWSLRHGNMRDRPFAEQKAAFIAYTLKWAPVTWLDPLYGRKRQRSARATGQYSLGGRSMVDFFLRFECLTEDIAALRDFLGLESLSMPEKQLKSGHRNRLAPWWEFHDDTTRALIARECADEIARFGYDFSDALPTHGPQMQRD